MRTLTVSTISDVTSIDLADPTTHAEVDLSGLWRFLRQGSPVHWHEGRGGAPGFWVITKHQDVIGIYGDDENFTSEKGNVLTTLLAGFDTASGKMLAVTDGRRHRELRNVLLKAFSPRALGRITDRVRAETDRRVAEAVARGSIDFAAEVSDHIPMDTVCDLLGVPHSDRSQLLVLNKSALSSEGPNTAYSDSWAARNEILMYFSELAENRRADPQDDVISALATGTVNKAPLSLQEIIFNCYSLILGGDETSRLAMSGAVNAFIYHPEQWLALRSGDSSITSAVEEVLRWTTPALHFGRVALRDVVIRDRTIRAGEVVTLWNCSANRDDEVFDSPFEFDLGRNPNRHVTFGFGRHFCLGAYLGRMEINALLESLRARVAAIEPAGSVRYTRSNLLSGISSLPVKLQPA